MIVYRYRLIAILAGNVVWVAGLLWLILASDTGRTHLQLISILLLMLLPAGICLVAFGMRRMPWAALSMKLLIAGQVLVMVGDGPQLLFRLKHPLLQWTSSAGMALIFMSMIVGFIQAVRYKPD